MKDLLLDQLTFHWEHQLRPRLDGLTDDEYHWAPASDPDLTIAWRLFHMTVEVLAMRNASHFDGPEADWASLPRPATAAEALADLDAAYAVWVAGIEALDEPGLMRPCGPAEGPFADYPLAALLLHIHRELIHHGAEVSLLRDLHPHLTHTSSTDRKDS